ncbi:PD-(D/E)XK nuclease-like domain-containing protein [Aquibacillus rhizosphaerae]|uniref:PD-(D/E)XK nuclease-like domain-containing protein n=1 Tax=Aquibacillus rhizosphaerae TaxID=3051431 RepID=A0ABT7LAD7_9BACI|nr:PD-(D/E)XK nuclease-like domain-containing protein [Aquibacillus sp. LR5S19]MDL4842807.1 PD-(D/E)XK nuclease-like domain-containing protein [Aquibacillus sp. LR5S19]
MTTLTKMKLNKKNYHSREADLAYMSVSQFKSFVNCEAKTLAKLKGEYVEPSTNALLVGSYVHAAFENNEVFNEVVEENSDAIFKKNGGKYADFTQADLMIDALKNDSFAMFALEGEKEQIFTAYLFGTEWKIKVDSVNLDRKTFSDIKTTQDLYKRYWSTKYDGWVSFIESWDYVLQMAIYRKVIELATGALCTPYIIAVTKENPPNKAVVHFDESRFDFEYEYAEMKLNRILQIKKEEIEPIRCDKCNYCKSTKELKDTIEVGALIYE